MDPRDKTWMLRRYDERLDQFGDDIRTLGSGTEERRRLRFEVLRDVGIASGCSVLDLGCGFGDFYGYLSSRGIAVDYLGLDINPRLLDVARVKYPSAVFADRDFLSSDIGAVDFIVASGTFNLALKAADNYEYVERIVRRAYRLARRGVAIDFHTSYVDFRVDDIFYYEPEKMLSMAKTISKRVTLRHDYPLYEFCLYVFPDFPAWGR